MRKCEMTLPNITHLQFLVLDILRLDLHSGRFLRARLAEEGATHSAPAFYQLMSRLENAQYVSGWYESFVIDGQTLKERKYEIMPLGIRQHDAVNAFYSQRPQHGPTSHPTITDPATSTG